MLNDLLKPYNFSITLAGNSKGTIAAYRLKCPPLNIDVGFSWLSHDDLTTTLKPKLSRFIAVVANGYTFDYNKVYDRDTLSEIVEALFVKLTPSSKLDSILEYIDTLAVHDGQAIELKTPPLFQIIRMWFHSAQEWRFYLDSAVKQGLVTKKVSVAGPESSVPSKTDYGLTVDGLTRLIKLSEGKSSNTCFIAMAFSDDMFVVLEDAIKPALSNCGFKHYVVSDEHIDSATTINDAILAGIKKARFTIADFTHHRNGVYFEAGYALGRGQKVIYTCRQDEMANSHFDINHYQHIVWTDATDFKIKLINKIEAFIKD
jgi:hypothetical protein